MERYERLTWDEEGTVVAVLKGDKDKKQKHRANILLAFTDLQGQVPRKHTFDSSKAHDFPKDMVISENGTLAWSTDLTKVFFGIREQEVEPEKKEDADPVPNVDIFHWQDERLQSVQIKQAERDRKFTFRSVFSLQSNRFLRLADEEMRTVTVTRDGRWAVGQNQKPYVSDWKPRRADYYRVDIETGEKRLMLEAHQRTLGLSPDSRHFLYWKDAQVWVYDLETGESRNLTENAPVSFVNEEFDRNGEKPPHGLAGWTKDGKGVILYGKYDLWLQPLSGDAATVLTGKTGAQNEIRLRYIRLDPEEKFIDTSQPILLSAYGQWTKKSGFFGLDQGTLSQLIFEDRRFGRPTKAEKRNKLMYTIESFADYPDYYVSDARFSQPERVTDANPWQGEYLWGHRVLFEYQNSQGVRLQGTLAIPDDYQEGQRLPMVVNFYEKNSQNLHRHAPPRYAHRVNFAAFVSNGYLIMQPDIHFNLRTSHSDMLECVEAAVKKVIEMGYADPERVGLHGHSYSGGGSCYIATRSKMFAAVAAGAAPINLVSEFNQLFKGSGRNNHQYDIYGQGRYTSNPYDDFELYWDQSPIAHVRTMDTPLLYLHGVDDPTVEYLQGMEFYNALRFNKKNVIFLSYPGEGHGLRKLENKKDFTMRIHQFFDHHLKGKPAPDWMAKGVPYLKKPK
jgi:dipeptidyl aminopeptidase/acylaminoacyl peptidase